MGTLLVLNHFVFSPLLAVVEERRRKTSGAHAEAIRFSKKTAEILSSYQDKIRTYRDELRGMRELVKQELARNESEHIGKLREGFIETMRETKKSIADQVLAAQAFLAADIAAASQDVLAQFMGKRT